MTENKKTVERYMDGFREGDHAKVLSCLTEDVVWIIPGMFHVTGSRRSTVRSRTRHSWVSRSSRYREWSRKTASWSRRGRCAPIGATEDS